MLNGLRMYSITQLNTIKCSQCILYYEVQLERYTKTGMYILYLSLQSFRSLCISFFYVLNIEPFSYDNSRRISSDQGQHCDYFCSYLLSSCSHLIYMKNNMESYSIIFLTLLYIFNYMFWEIGYNVLSCIAAILF